MRRLSRCAVLLALVIAGAGCATEPHAVFREMMNQYKGQPISMMYKDLGYGALQPGEHTSERPPHNPEAWFRSGACQWAVEYTRAMGIVVNWRYISPEVHCTERPQPFFNIGM
jgi:hypothetical protein